MHSSNSVGFSSCSGSQSNEGGLGVSLTFSGAHRHQVRLRRRQRRIPSHCELKASLKRSSLPEYYVMTVGLICIYARPFTNNYPVGELSEEIVPTEFKKLHGNIMRVRHRLFAHAQASFQVGKDDYPNEVVIEHDGAIPRISVPRTSVQPSTLERMVPLVKALIEKTNYHRLRFERSMARPSRSSDRVNFASTW